MPQKSKSLARQFLVLSLFTIIFSCKEDEVILTRPEVEILFPTEYSEFNPSDTILVEFRVSGDFIDLDASVQVLNTDHTPVFNAKIIENIPANQIVSCYYFLGDLFQPESLFDLTVTILQEGSYLTSEGCPIYINTTSQTLNSIWVVSKTNSVFLSIQILEPDLIQRNTLLYHGNYAGSDINSRGKQFVIAGLNYGDLSAYNTETLDMEWKVPIISNPVQPYFTGVKARNDLFYVSHWDGQTIGFNQQGVESSQAGGLDIIVPRFLHFISNKMITTGFQRSNVSQHLLMVNYTHGGYLWFYSPIDFEPAGFMDLDESSTLIFANNDDGKLFTRVYTHWNNLITEPYEPFIMPDEKVNCSCVLAAHHALLAAEYGIYQYIYQQMIYKISSIHDVSAISYDEVNELIWAASGNTLYTMTLSGEIVGEYTAENKILNFHLLYNQ